MGDAGDASTVPGQDAPALRDIRCPIAELPKRRNLCRNWRLRFRAEFHAMATNQSEADAYGEAINIYQRSGISLL